MEVQQSQDHQPDAAQDPEGTGRGGCRPHQEDRERHSGEPDVGRERAAHRRKDSEDVRPGEERPFAAPQGWKGVGHRQEAQAVEHRISKLVEVARVEVLDHELGHVDQVEDGVSAPVILGFKAFEWVARPVGHQFEVRSPTDQWESREHPPSAPAP